jgi:hypothetical protein
MKLIFGVMDLDRRNQKQRLKKEKGQKSNFFFFFFLIFIIKKNRNRKGGLKKNVQTTGQSSDILEPESLSPINTRSAA